MLTRNNLYNKVKHFIFCESVYLFFFSCFGKKKLMHIGAEPPKLIQTSASMQLFMLILSFVFKAILDSTPEKTQTTKKKLILHKIVMVLLLGILLNDVPVFPVSKDFNRGKDLCDDVLLYSLFCLLFRF